MFPSGTNQPIDALYIELALRTERLQQDAERAVQQLQRTLQGQLGQTAESLEKRFISVGDVIGKSLLNAGVIALQTRNPLAAVTALVQNLEGGFRAAAMSGNKAAAGLAGLAGIASGGIAVFTALAAALNGVVVPIKAFIEQSMQMAARLETMQISVRTMAQNVGVSTDLVNKKVQELVKQGITTREALESITQFMSFELPIENIDKLARAAQDMAVVVGQNSSATFSRFTYAIQSGSSEVLRMVGINKTASQMQEEYARTLGKTAQQLTDTERRQAIMNGILQYAANFTGIYEESLEAVGKQISSLPRYVEEATNAVGQAFLPILGMAVKEQTAFWKALRETFVEVDEHGNPVMKNGAYVLNEFGQSVQDAANGLKNFLQPIVIDLIKRIPELIQSTLGLIQKFSDLVEQAGEFIKIGKPFVDLLKEIGETAVIAGVRIDESFGAIQGIKDGLVALGQVITVLAAMTAAGVQRMSDDWANFNQRLRGEVQLSAAAVEQRMTEAFNRTALAMGRMLGVIPGAPKSIGAQTPEMPETRKGVLGGVELTGLSQQEKEAQRQWVSYVMRFGEVLEDGRKQIDEENKRYQESLQSLDKELSQRVGELGANFAQAMAQLSAQVNQKRQEIDVRAAEQLIQLEESAQKAITEIQRDYALRQLRQDEDFQNAKLQRQRRYLMQLTDAVQQRDARAVLDLMRQHQLEETEAEESRTQQQERDRQDYELQIQEVQRREDERRQKILDARERELADLQEYEEEARRDLRESYIDQLRDLQQAYQEQQRMINSAHASQLTAINAAMQSRLNMIAQGLATEGRLTVSQLRSILTAYQQVYGVGGNIDQIMSAFLTRQAQIASIIQQQMAQTAAYASRTDVRQPVIGSPGRYAEGGVSIASKPTVAVYGEKEPELAVFIPMSKLSGASSKIDLDTRSGQGEKLMRIHVTADNFVSPMFEDQVLIAIANVVENAVVVNRRGQEIGPV